MDKALSIVKLCSHPDMVIKANTIGGGIRITAMSGRADTYLNVSLEEISQLSSNKLKTFIQDCVKTVVAEVSQYLIEFGKEE